MKILNFAKNVGLWVLLWLVCLVVALAALVVIPGSLMVGSGSKAWRLLVSFDQLGNTALGGNEDETISSRCWRKKADKPYSRLVPAIDKVFLALSGEKDHCYNAWLDEVTRREREFKGATAALNTLAGMAGSDQK